MTSTITFRLRGVHLLEDERVAVVGSSPSLGFWNPKTTCCLKQSSEDSHQLCIVVEDSFLEYKYVILKGDQIQWEGGANRTVHPGENGIECDDTWVSEGASDFITCEQQVDDVPEDTAVGTDLDDTADTGMNKAGDAGMGTAADADENAPSAGGTTTVEVDENMPRTENVPPKVDDKQDVKQDVKKLDIDSRRTKQPFGSTDSQRSPFLLLDSIFRMCGRGTANAK